MSQDKIYGMVKSLQALAERCVEGHRGDGLAEPAVALCKALLEHHPDEQLASAPAEPLVGMGMVGDMVVIDAPAEPLIGMTGDMVVIDDPTEPQPDDEDTEPED